MQFPTTHRRTEKPVKRPRAMPFENEKELQNFMADVLAGSFRNVRCEVKTNTGGRADIVTEAHLIECKKVLASSDIKQAAGQIGMYKRHFPGLQHVIAGLTPRGEKAYKSALHTAKVIKVENNIDTWFIDEMPIFQEAYGLPKTRSKTRKKGKPPSALSLKIGSLILIAWLINVAGFLGLIAGFPIAYLAWNYKEPRAHGKKYH